MSARISTASSGVVFTGGVPHPTAEENFRTLAEAVGGRAPAYPDGDRDQRYFQPLADLAIGDAAVYLGFECNDGLEAMQRRIDAAKSVLPKFGVAHYRGYTLQADILPQVLSDLAAGAEYNAGP